MQHRNNFCQLLIGCDVCERGLVLGWRGWCERVVVGERNVRSGRGNALALNRMVTLSLTALWASALKCERTHREPLAAQRNNSIPCSHSMGLHLLSASIRRICVKVPLI